MGGGSSKTLQPQAAPTEVGEIDNSSGFHLIEIHAPSMGIGIGSIIFAIVLMGIAFIIIRKCYTQCWDQGPPRPRRQLNMEPLPYPHWPNLNMAMPLAPQLAEMWTHTLPALPAPRALPAIEMVPRSTLREEQETKNTGTSKYHWEA